MSLVSAKKGGHLAEEWAATSLHQRHLARYFPWVDKWVTASCWVALCNLTNHLITQRNILIFQPEKEKQLSICSSAELLSDASPPYWRRLRDNFFCCSHIGHWFLVELISERSGSCVVFCVRNVVHRHRGEHWHPMGLPVCKDTGNTRREWSFRGGGWESILKRFAKDKRTGIWPDWFEWSFLLRYALTVWCYTGQQQKQQAVVIPSDQHSSSRSGMLVFFICNHGCDFIRVPSLKRPCWLVRFLFLVFGCQATISSVCVEESKKSPVGRCFQSCCST